MHVCWQRSTCTSAAIGFQRLLCSDFDAVSGELEGRLLSVEWTKRIDVCRCEFTAVQLELHALQQTVPVSDAFDAVQRLVLLGQDDSHTIVETVWSKTGSLYLLCAVKSMFTEAHSH